MGSSLVLSLGRFWVQTQFLLWLPSFPAYQGRAIALKRRFLSICHFLTLIQIYFSLISEWHLLTIVIYQWKTPCSTAYLPKKEVLPALERIVCVLMPLDRFWGTIYLFYADDQMGFLEMVSVACWLASHEWPSLSYCWELILKRVTFFYKWMKMISRLCWLSGLFNHT